MYLVDYHTHTCCSPDSQAKLADMTQAAQRAGLRELCTTDHCDLLHSDGSLCTNWDWTLVLKQFEQANAACTGDGFQLRLGLELGGGYVNPSLTQKFLSGAPLDFVIGSVHNLSPKAGGQDLYYLDYTREQVCIQVLDDYMDSLLALAPLSCYDALGHILYPLRYINGRTGHHLSLERWQDKLDQILKTVADTGRAIEVNTHAGRTVEQWLPILQRYRQLGGEYVTLGSDAHRPDDVGKGLEAGARLLCRAGFGWLTVYRGRVPEQIYLS